MNTLNTLFSFIDSNKELSIFLLLSAIIIVGGRSSHQVSMKHLRAARRLLSFPSQSNELNIATIEAGKRYAIKVAGKEVFLKVLAIDEANAAFRIQWLSSANSVAGELWANGIYLESDQMPQLYCSAILARVAMEKKYFVGEGHVHA